MNPMTTPNSQEHPESGRKYLRLIHGAGRDKDRPPLTIDVYCVLDAFRAGSGAIDHAIKKLLLPGGRGTKERLQDLEEARDSILRAIDLERSHQSHDAKATGDKREFGE